MNVKEVQSDLNMLGAAYPPLVVDGVVGPLTTAAIKAFQASVTPPLAVDGVVGPATASALKGAVAALVASQAGASSQSAQGWMGRSPKVMAMAGARMRTRYRY
jgi:peptidoglycan hydrolase-like protein with peptidoglycan-binding domain